MYFDGVALNLQIAFGRVAMLTVLILLSMSMGYFSIFRCPLQFLLQYFEVFLVDFFTSLVRFIPKCFKKSLTIKTIYILSFGHFHPLLHTPFHSSSLLLKPLLVGSKFTPV